jgi:hypothetical protein
MYWKPYNVCGVPELKSIEQLSHLAEKIDCRWNSNTIDRQPELVEISADTEGAIGHSMFPPHNIESYEADNKKMF